MANKRTGGGLAGMEQEMVQRPRKKPKREYTEADAALAETFERLASEIEKERVKAALEIVNLYKTASSEKILGRLIRGLCSSRKAARPGFFIALTEVLKVTKQEPALLGEQNSTDVLNQVFERVKSETKVDGGASNQEKRNYLLGRLTAYSAIVHSGVAIGKDDDTTPYLDSLLSLVWEISQQASQLVEQCGKVYLDIVTIGSRESKISVIEKTLRFLTEKDRLRTPEGIAVWLQASQSALDVTFPKHIWHHKDPLSVKELPGVAKILSGSASQNNSHDLNHNGNPTAGNRRDAPHFAWTTILNCLFEKTPQGPKKSSGDPSSTFFRRFWIEVVDDVYFASSASTERKALGFRIFSIVLSIGPTWACEEALSPKMMSCVINQRSKEERFLHQAATALLGALKSRAISELTLAREVVCILVLKDGQADSDRINRSKSFISDMFHAADENVADCIMDQYTRILYRPGVTEQQKAESVRRMIADQLLSLTRLYKPQNADQNLDASESRPSSRTWRSTVLDALIRCACEKLPRTGDTTTFNCNPAISPASRDMFRSRLWSYLKELLNMQVKENVDVITSSVISLHDQGIENVAAISGNEQAAKAVSGAVATLKTLTNKKKKETPESAMEAQPFKLMFSMVILQVYCGELDAILVLDEIRACYDSFKGGKKSADVFDNIVEVILGFCSKPSALYRTLAEQLFSTFASEISAAGVESLVHVIEQEESLEGQRELFDQQDDEGDTRMNGLNARDEASSSEEDSQDSDVEVVDATVEDEASNEDNSSGDESNASSDEEDNDDDDSDEALNQALGQILQIRKPNISGNTNGAAGEEEDSSSSDESMDDEQMEALGIDNQLSAIFANRTSHSKSGGKISDKKRGQKDAKQNMLNFKNRVLDLLAIYVKQQHASPIAVDLILPLLRLIGKTRTPQIAKKASDLLETYFKAAKSRGMPLAASGDEIWEMLKEVHLELLIFSSKLHAGASSKCSLFLARLMMLKKEEGAMSKLIHLYADTHEQRFETMSKAPPTFWTDFVNWSVSMGSEK